jgi:hypothetical protein
MFLAAGFIGSFRGARRRYFVLAPFRNPLETWSFSIVARTAISLFLPRFELLKINWRTASKAVLIRRVGTTSRAEADHASHALCCSRDTDRSHARSGVRGRRLCTALAAAGRCIDGALGLAAAGITSRHVGRVRQRASPRRGDASLPWSGRHRTLRSPLLAAGFADRFDGC